MAAVGGSSKAAEAGRVKDGGPSLGAMTRPETATISDIQPQLRGYMEEYSMNGIKEVVNISKILLSSPETLAMQCFS